MWEARKRNSESGSDDFFSPKNVLLLEEWTTNLLFENTSKKD